MIDWKVEQLIKNKFQRGDLEGQIPDGWDEDQVVDYFAKYGVGSILSKGKIESEEAPEWAVKLARALDQVEKFILPAIERMNEEKRKHAEREAKFYSSLETDEERKLSRPAYPEPEEVEPKKYPKPEEEVKGDSKPAKYPYGTKDFATMEAETLADKDLQAEVEEERKKPKAYPYPPKSTPKEQAGQHPDYTKSNMVDPTSLARISLARVALSGLTEEERRELVRDFIKSKSGTRDLTFRSGSRQSKEKLPVEEGKLHSTQARNEDLRRRMFGKVTDAMKRENEAIALEENAAALPDRIKNLAERLSEIPLGHWTAKDMQEAEKYFTADQVHLIIERSKRTKSDR